MNTQLQPPCAFKIGDQYNLMQELHFICKQIVVNFKLKVNTNKTHYKIHCISSNMCPWYIHTSLITADGAGNYNTIEIKVFVVEYTPQYPNRVLVSGNRL